EELRSINEELDTVNTELKRRVEELGIANSDLQNFFSGTDAVMLFVDTGLRLRRFPSELPGCQVQHLQGPRRMGSWNPACISSLSRGLNVKNHDREEAGKSSDEVRGQARGTMGKRTRTGVVFGQ